MVKLLYEKRFYAKLFSRPRTLLPLYKLRRPQTASNIEIKNKPLGNKVLGFAS